MKDERRPLILVEGRRKWTPKTQGLMGSSSLFLHPHTLPPDMQCVATAPLVVTDRGGTTASRSRNCEGSEPLTRPNRGASHAGPCGFFLSILPLGLECVRTAQVDSLGPKNQNIREPCLRKPWVTVPEREVPRPQWRP